ncbi:MAG TPA: hypothetical protein DEA44_16920, partial [Firmicutes bacterium]|nr:hypothetical protein [Bacillota bacterium]
SRDDLDMSEADKKKVSRGVTLSAVKDALKTEIERLEGDIRKEKAGTYRQAAPEVQSNAGYTADRRWEHDILYANPSESELEKQLAQKKKEKERADAEYDALFPGTAGDFWEAVGYSGETAFLQPVLGAVEDALRYLSAVGAQMSTSQLKATMNIMEENDPNLKENAEYKEFKRTIERLSEDQLTTSLVGQWREASDQRYYATPQHKDTSDRIGGVMRMLPTIAANVAAPGSGIPFMSTSAAGAASREAFVETGDVSAALSYGTASGAAEGAIESMAGGIPGLNEGQLTKLVINNLSGTARGRRALSFLIDVTGEGGEEVVSGIVNPLLKRATYDPSAEFPTLDELGEQFTEGVIASAALQGAFSVGSKAVDIASNRTQKSNLERIDEIVFPNRKKASVQTAETVQTTTQPTPETPAAPSLAP